MKLVVVESPNKVKKIAQCLGDGFQVMATSGHFRDLPQRELGVDLTSFEPTYVVDPDKAGLLKRIREAATKAEAVLLATDADREGEAISWHLQQALRLKSPRRIRFQEITAKALQDAVTRAEPLDQHLVDAQQARRVLDRLVGFQVSPLLRALGSNHSAGRVQSATLHLVVEREKAREAFRPETYWTLTVAYENGLIAKYAEPDEKGVLTEKRLSSKEDADAVVERARGSHVVCDVAEKTVERKPRPPFTTSTLQQAASTRLRLRPERAMALAQSLFEKGFITYHRSDSVAVSEEAQAMARAYIGKSYPEALLKHPPVYKGKANAQEAHEAIRPTELEPIAGVTDEEKALYELICRRFLASQCGPALVAQTTVGIVSGDTHWLARGQRVVFKSFLRYLDDDEAEKEEAEPLLPKVDFGQELEVSKLEAKKQQTQPPPRFTEASLIKEMDRVGIGRPSTYAATIKTLYARDYIAEEKRFVFPTARGRAVDAVLGKTFEGLVESRYTSEMEDRLDEIASGKRRWKDEIRTWYAAFSSELQRAPGLIGAELAARPELVEQTGREEPKVTGKSCPRCSAPLLLRQGKKGPFLGCSGFPGCDYAADPSAQTSTRACAKCGKGMEELEGKYGLYARCLDKACGGVMDLSPMSEEKCPRCNAAMRNRGTFFSCSQYPTCKGTLDTKALTKARKANKTCPKCSRLLLQRKSAKVRFWGCSGYPACRHIESIGIDKRSATQHITPSEKR